MSPDLTARQLRELEYHEQHAAAHRADLERSISLDVVKSGRRRWWNAYWETYRLLRQHDLKGRRVLVLGCGNGKDVIRIAALGAEAYGCDLSSDLIEIAKKHAARAGLAAQFGVMPAERLTYPDSFFDAVFFMDILHHVDIPATMQEIRRVLKPGALVIGDELYTHSCLQRIRESGLVARHLYPRMVRLIYGTDRPYITADEHKIDEREFGIVAGHMTGVRRVYFDAVVRRVLPDRAVLAKADRLLLRLIGPLGWYLAGRIVFAGRLAK